MITKWKASAALALFLTALFPAAAIPAADTKTLTFAYVSRDADPRYRPHRLYTGLTLRDRHRPLAGAQTALRESRVVGRSLGLRFEMIETTLSEAEDAAAAIGRLVEDSEARIILLDLPLEDIGAAAAALTDEDVVLFNIGHGANALRGEQCAPVLFHTFPSDSMLTDAMAQYLTKRNWTDIRVLQGGTDADTAISAAFQASARKFGLDIVDVRPFLLTNDPRLRDQSNVALLTGGADYDAIFLADTEGEYGRYVPFATQSARPVVGTEGLTAGAWHWTWERHGAPQLNQRFDRIAKRRMTGADWAAWAAVKVIVDAAVRTRSISVSDLRAFLTSEDLTFDTYKGAPGDFRAWDNQLRQALLLHTHNAVIARAPIDGFLHRTNTLDTLGTDESETACRLE